MCTVIDSSDSLRIPLSKPWITDLERRAVMEVLESPNLSLGPKLAEFERRFGDRLGCPHAVAVNSGTSGLHLCIRSAGISDGDEVITSPFSFIASANCVLFEGGIPVFVDIDPDTWNIDVSAIHTAISPRTRALLPVHVFGRPCPMDEVMKIARRFELVVIEDACEAVGAKYKGTPAGTFGEMGVFAFYPNKQMTTGEGGMIVTRYVQTANLCRSWRNQGRGRDGAWLQHERLGYNYRLSDLNCALGIAQLSRLDEILRARASVAAQYAALLAETVPEVILPSPPGPHAEISWFVYVVRLRDEFMRSDRDRVLESLGNAGIGCSCYFPPIHLQPLYREKFGYRPGHFPNAERVAERTLALPFFSEMTTDEIERVCSALAQGISSLRHPSFAFAETAGI